MDKISKYKDYIIYGLVVAFFSITIFLCKETYTQISYMNLQLTEIKVELARVQASQITEKRCEEIATRIFYEMKTK